MDYTLIWTTRALDQLADVLVNLDLNDQDRFAADVEALNRQLADDPFEVGESRSNGFRIVFISFAAVFFRVDKADQVVKVGRVRPYG